MTRRVHTVRTRRRPWEDVQVDDATLLDLQRAGQLLPREPAADDDAVCTLCMRPNYPDHDPASPERSAYHQFTPPEPEPEPELAVKPKRRRRSARKPPE